MPVPGLMPSPGLFLDEGEEGFTWAYLQTEFVGNGTSFNRTGVNFGSAAPTRRLFVVVHSFRGSGVNLNLAGTPTIGGVNAAIHTTRSQNAGDRTCGVGVFSAEVPTDSSGAVTWSHAGLAGDVWFSMYRMTEGATTPVIGNTAAQTNTTATGITVAVPKPGIVLLAIMSCDASTHNLSSLTGMGIDRNGGNTRELTILGSQRFPLGDPSSTRTATYSLSADNVVSNWLTWGAAA